MKTVLLAVLCALAPIAHAAGPSAVATIDRSLWPDPIDTPAAFDRASRAEILAFSFVLAENGGADDEALKTRLNLKSVDREPYDRIVQRLRDELANNYQAAAKTCAAGDAFCMPNYDRDLYFKYAGAYDRIVDAKYRPWFDNAIAFHRTYRDELLRLAALFGRTNSEIDTLNANERRGDALPDRHFELTFDDGPTRVGGASDGVAAMLKQHALSATFYVLGERLDERVKQAGNPAALYAGQCVGMHGWEHQSHARWPEWQNSVTRVTDLVKATVPDDYVPRFRPPYGQRKTDSGDWFKAQGLTVELWNIDSQDWNAKIDADQVGRRVLTLMLLWRRGAVLFHDVHPKAAKAVPWILSQVRGAGIVWMSCRDLVSR